MLKALMQSVIAGGLSLGMLSQAWATTQWDMPTPYGERTFHTVNIRQFAADVAELTEGELQINVHSGGSLIAHPEIKNAVRRNLVPMGELIMSRLANENAIYNVDSVPYLATSYEDAQALWEASEPAIRAELARQGLQILFVVPWPPQGIYSRSEITRIEDLRNLRMRAYNTSSERFTRLVNAVPTQVEVPDIPTAFGTGRVAAMMTSPATGVDTQAWDYLSHYNHTQLWLPKNMVIVSDRALRRLSEETRAALFAAAEQAQERGWQMSREETERALVGLRENGIHVSDPTPELDAALREVGATMTAEWQRDAGAAGEEILRRYRAAD
ncbi:TRAP transporter substrate-binding protein [Marinospirillum sp. MEB164]|uniref:TRAP transporter substrate-binding protein n=1 Tax=Marinospirillum alkalitolerans TaxID=3123374 RepID=A0ABW8PWN0_9GAMM